MRVQIVDPSAFTPPYDRALCAALARAGAEVELVTSRFVYGPVQPPDGYAVTEAFYRRHGRRGADARARRAVKLAEHVPDMLRYRRHARDADVVHYQWLTVPRLDRFLLPRVRPRVLTLHYPLPVDPSSSDVQSIRRLAGAMDAVVVHTEHAERRLIDEFDIEPRLVERIPHGTLDYLTRLPETKPLPGELAAVEGPVILAFGLIRDYKGTDVLLEAFRELEGAELWIVGMPLNMSLDPLRELAARARGTVRFVDRFVTDPEIPAFMRRADIVVLPYRQVEQSGVLYAALAFGKPLVLSAVGGFPEVAKTGAGELVPPGDAGALAATLAGLIEAPDKRNRLAKAAEAAASGLHSWHSIAERTLNLYRRLLRE